MFKTAEFPIVLWSESVKHYHDDPRTLTTANVRLPNGVVVLVSDVAYMGELASAHHWTGRFVQTVSGIV